MLSSAHAPCPACHMPCRVVRIFFTINELDSVRDDLATVVDQALQPAHVSLWISQRG